MDKEQTTNVAETLKNEDTYVDTAKQLGNTTSSLMQGVQDFYKQELSKKTSMQEYEKKYYELVQNTLKEFGLDYDLLDPNSSYNFAGRTLEYMINLLTEHSIGFMQGIYELYQQSKSNTIPNDSPMIMLVENQSKPVKFHILNTLLGIRQLTMDLGGFEDEQIPYAIAHYASGSKPRQIIFFDSYGSFLKETYDEINKRDDMHIGNWGLMEYKNKISGGVENNV